LKTPSPRDAGKIVRILDDHTVVIDLGFEHAIEAGLRFAIYSPSDEIIDPDTNESLGSYRRRKGIVVVDEVHDRFSVASTPTIREETVEEVAANPFMSTVLGIGAATTRRQTRATQPPLDVARGQIKAVPGGSEVAVGDTVELISERRIATR
jgi:hypothetical protein